MQFNGLTGCYASKTLSFFPWTLNKRNPCKKGFQAYCFQIWLLFCAVFVCCFILVHASKMHENMWTWQMSSKQLLKFKEHKILRVGKKRRYSCAFKQAKSADDMVPWFPTIAPRVKLHESMGLIYTGIQSPKHPWVYRLCLGMLNN